MRRFNIFLLFLFLASPIFASINSTFISLEINVDSEDYVADMEAVDVSVCRLLKSHTGIYIFYIFFILF